MLKRLMISTAAAALVVGSAIAQDTPRPMDKSPPVVQKDMPKSDAAGAREFVTQQTADQWLASKFRGTDVIGNNNEKIGDVNDILFDRNGVPGRDGSRHRQAEAGDDPGRLEERTRVQGLQRAAPHADHRPGAA